MPERRRILLVDDNDFYRGALKSALLKQGHEVTEAGDGRGAQHILGVQPFDVVISDIQMPILDGVELLKWIKANYATPVILITGFSEIFETSEAYRLGASEFLLKPFKSEDIAAAIQKVLREEPAPEVAEDLDCKYSKIPLGDFVTGSQIHFNIFIRISSSKYVRIAYKGEDISVDRIRSYKNKGVNYVYVTREDFAKYVGFSLDLAKRVRASSEVSAEKKINFLRYTAEVVLESLHVESVDEEAYATAKDFIKTSLEILAESGEAVAILEAMNAHADFLYAHSLAVSLYSVIVAREMGWHSCPVLFKTSIGGLFHDIGLKEISREILEKPRAAMSQEERTMYETHAVRGMELLNQMESAPSDAIMIAYQHHEDCNGFGYPKKLAKNKIHPMARVVAVADLFCEIAIKGPGTNGLCGVATIDRMLQLGANRLDPDPLAALRRVFKHGPEARGTPTRSGNA